jgi:hypothetical protein
MEREINGCDWWKWSEGTWKMMRMRMILCERGGAGWWGGGGGECGLCGKVGVLFYFLLRLFGNDI